MTDKTKQACIQFDDLIDRFANEIRRGDHPQIEEYVEQHPEHADSILRLFPVLELMERNDSPVQDLSESGLLQAEMMQLNSTPPLRKLGDYRILREIGRGGMGIVFEAAQESLGRIVALKLLPESAQFDERRQQRFQQEALASAQLHHTNIVPVFGVGTHNDTAYFVMQFIDGQPLDSVITELSRIRTNDAKNASHMTEAKAHAEVSTIASLIVHDEDLQQPDSSSESGATINPATVRTNGSNSSASSIATEGVYWRNIAKIGIQVANALEHAHSRKILHRDIKPSNLMLDKSGCTWVTDFGLAKYFGSPDLTRTGEVLGTLRYMSPEQLNGTADERSDVFSLGLTLYELAGLRPAYDAVDRSQLMKQVIEARPKPLRTINRQIPKDLETIIQKCIASDPGKRYPRAIDVAQDLNRFVTGQPVLARRISAFERSVKWCRRRPAVASLCAALTISLIAGIAGITWQWQKTADALLLANENLNEANRQTQVSKEHFRQARESVSRFFTVVSQQRLLREPGFQPLRKELMQEALDYHTQFVSQYRDDNELKRELAQSLYYIAEIEGTLNADPSLADALDEPINIFSDLIESELDDSELRLWLARCMSLKSRILGRFDLKRSLANLHNAIEVLETLRSDFPEANFADDELAKNYQMLGLTYEQLDRAQSRTDRSLDNYTKSLQLRQKIQSESPNNLENTVRLAEVHRDLGITYRRMADSDQAIEHYDQALALLQPIVERDPDSMLARKALGSIANSIGFFYGRGRTEEDYEKALSFYEISKQQYQALADNNPLVIEYQDGVARAALNAGGVYQVQGQLEKALENREYAEQVREKLCNLNPDAIHLRSSWAVSLNGVGSTLRDLGRIDESIAQHQLAHEQHVRAVLADKSQTITRLRLIDGIIQIARVQSAGQMFSEAVESIDSIEEHTSPTDSRPLFYRGREYSIIASKIGQLTEDEKGEPQTELLSDCLEKAKTALTEAAERGMDVVKWSQRDAAFQNFGKYPECAEILAWLSDEFKPE